MNKPIGHLRLKDRKETGAHYTPTNLSDFLASQIIKYLRNKNLEPVNIADPAVGDGELLESLARNLTQSGFSTKVQGFDIDLAAVEASKKRLKSIPGVESNIFHKDFIDYVIEQTENNLFQKHNPLLYDAVIANPPYVRTQVLGSKRAQTLAKHFNLKGRIDLYHAFILGIARLLKSGGILGIIVSNRFMTTKSGEEIRKNILNVFDIIHIWDFGDTQLFEAAVLPAVLLLQKKSTKRQISSKPKFTSIYSTQVDRDVAGANDFFEVTSSNGLFKIANKGIYKVQQGILDANGVWKISNKKVTDWIKKVDDHTAMTFGDIGKIKVGVKTTADKVFIKSDWNGKSDLELLRKLTTHHVARRYKALTEGYKSILYPHAVVEGTREAVNLDDYPKTKEYLLQNRDILEKRDYVIKAGRKWYEIWVPHDPDVWEQRKIVFRDISDKPTFWLDEGGTVVNGDCYWLVDNGNNKDILWLLLAVANSSFIEKFYDYKFNNKLYSGRRRFISKYVEKFPLPSPTLGLSKRIIIRAKEIYKLLPEENTQNLEKEVDDLVWQVFGF